MAQHTSDDWDVFVSYVTSEEMATNLPWDIPAEWHDATKTFPEIFKDHLLSFDPGLRVFIDKAELQQGEDWQQKLEGALRSCKLLVAFVTPSFGKSKWATREVSLADDRGIKIMPINLLSPGSEWPPPGLLALATTQYIPCEAGPARIAQQIQKELARIRPPQVLQAPSEAPAEGQASLEAAREAHAAPTLSLLMDSIFNCQSRLSALANERRKHDLLLPPPRLPPAAAAAAHAAAALCPLYRYCCRCSCCYR